MSKSSSTAEKTVRNSAPVRTIGDKPAVRSVKISMSGRNDDGSPSKLRIQYWGNTDTVMRTVADALQALYEKEHPDTSKAMKQ